jgi:hypothetical protein
MRMGNIMSGKVVELPWLQGVKHAHITHWQSDRRFRLTLEQADGFPARRFVLRGDAAFEPDRRARNQQRMQAWCVTGAFVEQVLQAAAHFDCKDVNERIGDRTAKPEPQTVRKRAHPCRARDFQRRRIIFAGGTRPRFQPDAVTAGIGHFETGWGLRPGPNAFPHIAVECLKTHHF